MEIFIVQIKGLREEDLVLPQPRDIMDVLVAMQLLERCMQSAHLGQPDIQ